MMSGNNGMAVRNGETMLKPVRFIMIVAEQSRASRYQKECERIWRQEHSVEHMISPQTSIHSEYHIITVVRI
jgi:hypothetical protein